MTTKFTTNIDCCKKFMGHISGLPIKPNVGDRVRVYNDPGFEIWMEVTARNWTFTNGSTPVLTCYLSIDGTIPQFEKLLREHGIRW